MIYFDHNATTPVLPEVFEAMRPYFCDEWGNPSSAYRFGSKLKTFIGSAREQVAGLIGALPEEILFTSCATESNNAAIQAVLKSNPAKRHIVTSAVEHSSVLNHSQALEKEGYRVTCLRVNRDGSLNLADLENALTGQTAVVSLMWANNETGVLFPVQEIAELCRERGVLFHCDAVQAAGKVEMNVRTTQVDYLSLSGHKFYAPKGGRSLRPAELTFRSFLARRTSRERIAWRNRECSSHRRLGQSRRTCIPALARLRRQSASIARQVGNEHPHQHCRHRS
jgi:cysteine desulfurase